MPAWRFRALGSAELGNPAQGSTLYPERKTAALFLYLSLEGLVSLAGLELARRYIALGRIQEAEAARTRAHALAQALAQPLQARFLAGSSSLTSGTGAAREALT